MHRMQSEDVRYLWRVDSRYTIQLRKPALQSHTD